jgi:hypothetical protein
MEATKHFLIGAMVMALIASVAFNCYQQGQLKNCVIASVQPIELR